MPQFSLRTLLIIMLLGGLALVGVWAVWIDLATPVQPPPRELEVAGDYFCGDKLGFNLELTLQLDGHFTCRWSGCLGEYGLTSGEWIRHGNRISIVALESTGSFVDQPLGDMTILQRNGKPELLREFVAKVFKDDPAGQEDYSFRRVIE